MPSIVGIVRRCITEEGGSAKTALALLDREVHKANTNVKLKLNRIHDTLGRITVEKEVTMIQVSDDVARLHKYINNTINDLTITVKAIDEHAQSQYTPWFTSQLLSEPFTQVDFEDLKAKLQDATRLRLRTLSGSLSLTAVPEEFVEELELRLFVHGISEVGVATGVVLESIVTAKKREYSRVIKIYQDCAVPGQKLRYVFLYAPADLVGGLPGTQTLQDEREIVQKLEVWSRRFGEEEAEEDKRKESPVVVTAVEPSKRAGVFVDFDLKSLLANERTFLSWANVATGVATAGLYLGNVSFLITGLAFIWLALILLVLRRRSIAQEKVGLVIRSPWFATLFAGFVLTVVLLRITSR